MIRPARAPLLMKVGENEVAIKRNFYTGLWEAWYIDASCPKFAGPFKTRKECIEAINRHNEKD